MWLTDLADTAACPTCPSPQKNVGQPETVAAVGLSQLSHLSHSKTCGAKRDSESKPPVPLPMPWTPDTYEGRPCCYLPHVPERLRGLLPPDLKGFGIPAQGLPQELAQFSLAGWKLELDGNDVRMIKAHAEARMERGCRDYLQANKALVLAALRQWGATCV